MLAFYLSAERVLKRRTPNYFASCLTGELPFLINATQLEHDLFRRCD